MACRRGPACSLCLQPRLAVGLRRPGDAPAGGGPWPAARGGAPRRVLACFTAKPQTRAMAKEAALLQPLHPSALAAALSFLALLPPLQAPRRPCAACGTSSTGGTQRWCWRRRTPGRRNRWCTRQACFPAPLCVHQGQSYMRDAAVRCPSARLAVLLACDTRLQPSSRSSSASTPAAAGRPHRCGGPLEVAAARSHVAGACLAAGGATCGSTCTGGRCASQ